MTAFDEQPRPSIPADLLRPTLTAADDVTGFHRPWSPDSLLFASFFLGAIPGGIPIVLNFRRLGIAGQGKMWLSMFIAAFLALFAFRFGVKTERIPLDPTWLTVCERSAAVLLAWLAMRQQRPRFRVFLGHGGEAEPVLLFALLLFAVSIAIAYGADSLIVLLGGVR